MNGGNPVYATQRTIDRAASNRHRQPRPDGSGDPPPAASASATTTSVSPIRDPTDRSIPPPTMTTVAPIAAIPMNENARPLHEVLPV